MSDYRTRATAEIEVNGNAAQQLTNLKQRAEDFRNAIARAYKEGDDKLAKKLTRDLKGTEKQIKAIQSQTANVEMTMRRLDKASPKELRQTLRALEKDLQKVERGSDAWKKQAGQIRQVKEELKKVNNELNQSEGKWSRFNRVINEWQTSIMGAAAAVTGLVVAGKAAVQAYAEMDAEMASVRKFTGMTAEEVEQLNEEFKKIDTRTSREDLNKLAQEAGRLGLQSQEDVLGFVKAANQINVALDDLGDGATLTLSKLTDIFGDKERLGVEGSLLAVGSVINELSQNCTASAPYLANFAQRMAGVGAQAKMTIPQIMGFAAVLDSQGQAVEMSATAVSKLVMDMFKQQDKIISATGINAEKFKEALTRSTNEGLVMLLERLHELGSIDTLAPVFKDMGENGARAAQVMAALAGNIDMVKQQQAAATAAFNEATSVTNEYNVQNNTVQAELDKARKGFTEMAVALGQKLMPVMRYAISGTSALMRALSATIDFVINYKGTIITLATTWTAYTIAVNASNIAFKTHYYWIVVTEKAQKILTAGGHLLKMAFYAITGQIKLAKAEYIAFNTLTKTTPWGAIIAAVTALATAIYMYYKKAKDAREEQARLKEEAKKASVAIGQVEAKIAEETSVVKRLTDAINAENMGSDKRNALIKEFNNKFGGYLENLLTEKSTARDVANAYAEVVKNLRAKLLLEAKEKDFKGNVGKRYGWEAQRLMDFDKAARDGKLPVTGTWLKAAADEAYASGKHDYKSLEKAVFQSYAKTVGAVSDGKDYNAQMAMDAYLRQYISTRHYEAEMDKKWQPYENDIDAAIGAAMDGGSFGGGSSSGGGHGGGNGGGSGSTGSTDKFKAEKEWKEYQDALNRIEYAKGEKNYEDYTKRMLEIEQEFYKRELEHSGLSSAERASIEAQMYETIRKLRDENNAQSVEEENDAYEERKARAVQDYMDGLYTADAYNGKLEQLELEHLKRIADIRNANAVKPNASDKDIHEYQKAYNAYQQALLKDQMKQKEAYEKELKEHADKLKDIWDKYFVTDEEKRKLHYNVTKKLIEEAYEAELAKEGYTAKEKLEIQKRYKQALKQLEKENEKDDKEKKEPTTFGDFAKGLLGKGLKGLADKKGIGLTEEDMKNFDKSLDHMFASASSLFSSLNQMWQLEEQEKLAALEKRYDREMSMAEGNAYKMKELEKKKAKEQAQIKAKAQKRMFAQQVLSAVAQNAIAAINAYSSAAAIPVIGHTLAPIAAAMALAAGALQIAVIQKQQSASDAQGYAKGGFTPDGPTDQPVGIVHAGEWVASKKLVNNPAARPAIDALEYAQRNNKFASLSASSVSRSITAGAVMAGAAEDGSMQRAMIAMSYAIGQYGDTMDRLGKRLDEPFVTVNTVSGDKGIKQAQDEYQRLQNNSLPKSKRK